MNNKIEEILRNPAVLKTAEGDGYTDETACKWAWLAHGYDTGMEPFYSIEQVREAVRAVAAPELLAALQAAETVLRYLPDLNTNWGGERPTMTTRRAERMVKAAIAKATGGAQ